jgi:hypothetical protein
MSQKKVLIVQYYIVKSADKEYQRKRQAEVDHCFLQNLQNPQLSEIHVLTEQQYDFAFVPADQHPKIKQTVIGKRLTYEAAFDYYNEHLANTICILANADIYTNESLELLDHVNFTKAFLGLNRYEDDYDDKPSLLQGLEYNTTFAHTPPYTPLIFSQDAWIWKLPSITIPGADFNLGVTGCEHYIAYLAVRAGLVVYNPSHLIAINHYDKMSVKISHLGKIKGGVSEKREQRIADYSQYVFLKNTDTICDKYTSSIRYNIVGRAPMISSLTINSSLQPLASMYPFNGSKVWYPSDKESSLECLFEGLQSIKIIDIRGRPVDKDNHVQGYVSKFKISYLTEDGWVHDATEYKGLTTKNGNLIKRTYLDLTCKGIRIYPLAHVGSLALQVRFFASK